MRTPRDQYVPAARTLRLRAGRVRITLGVAGLNRGQRDAIAGHVRELRRAARSGLPPAPAAVEWLARVPQPWRDRLAAAGIEPPELDAVLRRSMTLGRLVDLYAIHGQAAGGRVAPGHDAPAGWAPATRESVDRACGALLERLGRERTVRSVGIDELLDVDQWVGAGGHGRARPLADASRRHARRVWRGLFAFAVRLGVIDRSPAAMLPSRAVVSSVRVLISREDRAAVLACLRGPDRLYFALAAYAGLRAPSETDALTWGQWDRRARVLRDVAERKTRRVRPIAPVPPELHRELEAEHLRQLALGLGRDGDPVLPAGVLGDKSARRRRVVAAIRAAALKPWPRTMDSLREAVETDLARAGVDPSARAIVMGHSPRVGHDAYLHVDAAMLAGVTDPERAAKPRRVKQEPRKNRRGHR